MDSSQTGIADRAAQWDSAAAPGGEGAMSRERTSATLASNQSAADMAHAHGAAAMWDAPPLYPEWPFSAAENAPNAQPLQHVAPAHSQAHAYGGASHVSGPGGGQSASHPQLQSLHAQQQQASLARHRFSDGQYQTSAAQYGGNTAQSTFNAGAAPWGMYGGGSNTFDDESGAMHPTGGTPLRYDPTCNPDLLQTGPAWDEAPLPASAYGPPGGGMPPGPALAASHGQMPDAIYGSGDWGADAAVAAAPRGGTFAHMAPHQGGTLTRVRLVAMLFVAELPSCPAPRPLHFVLHARAQLSTTRPSCLSTLCHQRSTYRQRDVQSGASSGSDLWMQGRVGAPVPGRGAPTASAPTLGAAAPGRGPAEHPLGEYPSRTLFVRNINIHTTDGELLALFRQHGEIRSMYAACKHRGFVMISYYDIRASTRAKHMLQVRLLF